jgi:hypothetical protein
MKVKCSPPGHSSKKIFNWRVLDLNICQMLQGPTLPLNCTASERRTMLLPQGVIQPILESCSKIVVFVGGGEFGVFPRPPSCFAQKFRSGDSGHVAAADHPI